MYFGFVLLIFYFFYFLVLYTGINSNLSVRFTYSVPVHLGKEIKLIYSERISSVTNQNPTTQYFCIGSTPVLGYKVSTSFLSLSFPPHGYFFPPTLFNGCVTKGTSCMLGGRWKDRVLGSWRWGARMNIHCLDGNCLRIALNPSSLTSDSVNVFNNSSPCSLFSHYISHIATSCKSIHRY